MIWNFAWCKFDIVRFAVTPYNEVISKWVGLVLKRTVGSTQRFDQYALFIFWRKQNVNSKMIGNPGFLPFVNPEPSRCYNSGGFQTQCITRNTTRKDQNWACSLKYLLDQNFVYKTSVEMRKKECLNPSLKNAKRRFFSFVVWVSTCILQ